MKRSTKVLGSEDFLQILSYVYSQNHKPEQAIALWRAMLLKNPDDTYALKNMAKAHFDAKDYDAAIEFAEQYLALDSTDAAPMYMIISRAYWAKKQPTVAQEWAKRYMENASE